MTISSMSAVPSLPTEPTVPTWHYRSRRSQWMLYIGWLALAMLFTWSFQIMTHETIWDFVADAPKQAADIGSRMLPPAWRFTEELLYPLWETFNIATLGTALGVIMAVPVAFLAARNTTPNAWCIRPLALLVIVSSRSINSLIWALLLVAILGPGMLAGIIAIAFRSIGFIGKLLYETIEEIDQRQVEAVTATGASSAQVMTWAILPQVKPSLAGMSLFRWDINIRESTILGLVGAGGIGLKLDSALSILAWPRVTMILIAILLTVIVSEWIAASVRKRLI